MRVLVIPDVHLKPWMFKKADEIIKEKNIDQVVCLMDIPDDWNQGYNIQLYEETYAEACRFAKEHPDSLWCYGNHDLSYRWMKLESGFSFSAESVANRGLHELEYSVKDPSQFRYIHRIDNVLFMHGGLSDDFVRTNVRSADYNDPDKVIEQINALGEDIMWQNGSPLWLRPQHRDLRMYKPRKFLQVVGHTPMTGIEREGNIISCDVFSTDRERVPIGTQKFPVIETTDWSLESYG